ncbi:MAG: NAD-dependent epimerase/dehydratase family protein [Verrucomicrobiota bacterium]
MPLPKSRLQHPESVLVTGGAGFVGSHLSLAVKGRFPSARVVAMDNLYRKGSELNVERLRNAGCEFVQGDIREREQFPDGPFAVVLECSAEPSVLAGINESPDYLMQTNLMGTYECLEKSREWGASIIFLSTSRVYPIAEMEAHPWQEEETRFSWKDRILKCGIQDTGKNRNPVISSRGVREELTHQSGARSLYGFTKYASELLIEEYRANFGLQAVINRCSVIAGPWQMGKVDQGVVGLWVLRHYFKQPLSYIGYGGKGKQVRDVLHVSDLSKLICRQIADWDQWEGWCGNVGGGLSVSVSLLELTSLCEEVTGNRIEIHSVPETRQADLRVFLADCSRIEQQYGWRPEHAVRHIVQDVFEWIRENEDSLKKLEIF